MPDVFAIEEAVRHTLLRCSLPQALDFLHTQLLAGICVANPVRDSPTIHPSPPLACYLTFPPRVLQEAAVAPRFRCWITRRISPNMAVISLKCNSSSWACSLAKGHLGASYHFGFFPGNFLQLAFPCSNDFTNDNNAHSVHFAFAIYLLSTSGGKGRISTETPQTKQKMQEPLKSPSSPVFYSLFSYVLPIVLTTHMHVRTKCSLSSVSHFFLAMRNNLQKPSHSPSWTWTTLSTCLSPLYPVSSPGLSKFLFTDSLTHLDGQDLTPRFLISPVLPRKPSTSPLFPGSCTFSRTFFPLASSHLSNITSLKISSAMILPVLITSNPTSFSLGLPLNP